MHSELDAQAALLQRVEQLEQENAQLWRQAEDIAEANVRAAMQLVEMHAERERELTAKNQEIEQALARAEEASRQKSRFLANMSHELRTPLSGIRGMAELLRDSALNPVQGDYVDAIARTADSFLELVNQLLDFAKIEAGRVELEHIEFDLWELLEDQAQLLQVGADRKGLDFAFELAADVPRRVRGDSLRLRQIVQNLASNAVKFTPTGRVCLAVQCAGTAAAPELQVELRDSGVGIPAEVAGRLFEPFVQADASTSRCFGGTGLGLVISRHLAQRMGGSLAFSSEVGIGTTFVLRLPLEALACAVPPSQQRGRAVVVTRASATARLLAAHLGALGYAVDSAASLDEPVVAGHDVDLMVLDCAADGGDERRLATLRRSASPVPLLLLVHGGAAVGAMHAAEGALVQWIERPLRPTRLLRAIEALGGGSAVSTPIAAAGADVHPELAGMRVLVAEDTPVNRRVVRAQLERLGCVVECVEDGAAAIAATAARTFDCVLMDCHMPGVDGYEATAAIRAREAANGGRVPIVALTANALPDHARQCLAIGMDGHLTKPVRRGELAGALLPYAPRRR